MILQINTIFNKNKMQFWKLCTRQIAATQTRWLNINQNSMKTSNAISLDRISSQPGTAWNSKCLVNAEKEKEFLDLFPVVVNDLTNNTIDPHFAEANTRYDELLRYLTPFGKKLRAFITFIAYEVLEKPENVTPENRKLAMIMAWALELRDVKPPLGVEIWECGEENLELETRRFLNSIAAVLELHSASLIADDIIDEGVMRRGSFCWHRKENIGFKATNDALLLEQGTYILLRKYFKNHHCYLPSMLLFHDITLRIGMGQAADCMSVKDGKSQLQLFTMDRFKCIAEHKTGFYTFYLPIALAMYMANIYDMELHRKSEDLSKDLTFLYQVQDDFMDCYGNPETSGKKGTNIQEGKCTWLAVMAMKKANHYQIETLKQCYGSKDPEAVTTVLNLFEELNLKDIFKSSVEESLNHIRKNITQNISNENLQTIYFKILKALEQRSC